MEQETHFKLQVFGSIKPDVFDGFVDCLGMAGVYLHKPFLDIEEMLLDSDQSYLDFYDIISFSAASGKLAGASYIRGELVSEQFGKGQKKHAAPKPRLVA